MKILGNYHIINSTNYGKILVNINELSKFANVYFVMSRKRGQKIEGIVDKNGNEIIPFEKMELKESFINDNKTDVSFGFKYPDSEYLEYYHIKIKDNGKAKLVLKTSRNDETPLKISKVLSNPNYWIFETLTGKKQYAIYDYIEERFKTTFLDEIVFLEDKDLINNHAIYYEADIDVEFEDGTYETYTSLCGFLDMDGNFSSQILETENEFVYDTYAYGPNTLSKMFLSLKSKLETEAIYKIEEKSNRLLMLRTELHNNYDMSDKPVKLKKDAKILEFKPKGNDNNEKK